MGESVINRIFAKRSNCRRIKSERNARMDIFEEEGGVKLIRGDVLSVLPTFDDNSFDALITDPPYCSGAAQAAQRTQSPECSYFSPSFAGSANCPTFEDGKDQRVWMNWMTETLRECCRVLKDGSPFFIFVDWRQLPALTDCVQVSGLTWRGVGVWHKNTGRPSYGLRHDVEFIVWGSRGQIKDAYALRCLSSVFKYPSLLGTRRLHITQKPLGLMKDLLNVALPRVLAKTKPDFTFIDPSGFTVLDPFCGSGTTLLAAKDSGCKSVGVDSSKAYIEIARKRLLREAKNEIE